MSISQLTSVEKPKGMLFILSGPSGVGKDTILRHALPHLGAICSSISVTTRPPRRAEIDGRDYFFVSAARFAEMLEEDDLLEHAEVHGHSYGTPRSWVLEQLRAGTDIVLEIDVQGALQVKSLFPQAILIFLAPPSWQELAHRLQRRATEDAKSIYCRLQAARSELARVNNYQYLIINDRLHEAVQRLRAIIEAERCRPERQNIAALLNEEITDD